MRPFLYFIVLLLCSACERADLSTPPANDPPGANAEMLRLVNDIRSKGCDCGNERMPPVSALTWNSKLEAAARQHSDYMNTTGDFNHTQSNGSTPASRATQAGYTWSFVAENIAAGHSSIAQVMAGWLNSPGHCKNIMSAQAREMGAARSGIYWTQIFGSPR